MSNMKSWNVLIVEDELDGQEVVQEILGYFNIATNVVGTAEEAIELLGKRSYTAAVIDLGLPGIDGLELVRYIRDQNGAAEFALRGDHSVSLVAVEAGSLRGGL